MAKTVLFISMSLDGYLADVNGSIDWLSDVVQTEEDLTYDKFYKDVSAVILGRVTYDQITTQLAVDHYPYSNVDSYVITREKRKDLDHVYFTNEDVVDVVKKQRDKYDGILWIVGGSSLIQPLVEANLIDEYQISVMPMILGDGVKLFKPTHKKIPLSLKKSEVINEMVYLTYEKRD